MDLYSKLVDAYTNSITNLFTIAGNINDVDIFEDKQKNITIKLLEDLLVKNHVMIYTPSTGLYYLDTNQKKELYELDSNLEKEHDLIFKKGYANSQYNIVSGLHIIKTMINTYRDCRVKYGNKVKNLVIFIDHCDIVFPNKQIEQMSIDEKMAISLIREITSQRAFMDGKDVIILGSESYYSINEEVRNLQTNYHIEISLPNNEKRLNFINFITKDKEEFTKEIKESIALRTAGINLITLGVLLKKGLNYLELNLNKDVANILTNKLGQYVEIFNPRYGFDKVISYDKLKEKARGLIKRMYSESSWRALAYIGPTGSGKDFHTEAFLFEANLPVIKLKNIKSKWYGETSIIIDSIQQVARAFDKVCIFKPEADKLFPNPEDKSGHQADQELAGLFLDWMSDSRDKGKIFWIFNTSRPQMFPVDFQRRIEIKLPVLDIVDQNDRYEFIKAMFLNKGIDLLNYKLPKIKATKLNKISGDKIKHSILSLTNDLSSDNIRMIVNEVASEYEIDNSIDIIDVMSDINVSTNVIERTNQTNMAKNFSTYKSLI